MVIDETMVGMCLLLQVGIYHNSITWLAVWDNEMCLISLNWKYGLFNTLFSGKKMCLVRPLCEPRLFFFFNIGVKCLQTIRASKF